MKTQNSLDFNQVFNEKHIKNFKITTTCMFLLQILGYLFIQHPLILSIFSTFFDIRS